MLKAAKRIPLKGKTLDRYIRRMTQRIETAYCLAEDSDPPWQLPDIRKLDKKQLEKMLEAGKRIVGLVGCPKFHGKSGISDKPHIPNLAGQNFGYLANQLRAFQGEHSISTQPYGNTLRMDSSMKKWTAMLTQQNKTSATAYYSSLDCKAGAAKRETAAKIPRQIDVCLSCHRTSDKGTLSVVPLLRGQKKDYISQQSRAFRLTKGEPRSVKFRNRRFHQFMSAIAGQLTNDDIERLAIWFSSQPCDSGS